MQVKNLQITTQHNCDISDARDNGIYSICTLVLKLRNHYKWENLLEPWDEPDSPTLLDWIEAKENYWQSIASDNFQEPSFNNQNSDPYDVALINGHLTDTSLIYGAGYGRSLKSIFFLAEKIESKIIDGCPVFILGREMARELASPFAMLQDGIIYIRRNSLRFFFWDQIQEIRSSSRAPLQHALALYGVMTDDKLNRKLFQENLDRIVDQEIPTFIHHEIGEMHETTLDSATLKIIIRAFPGSAIEFLARTIKDMLADTHPKGMLGHIISEQKETSLAFYVGFLDGLRKVLAPEIIESFNDFLSTPDWAKIDQARKTCRAQNLERAEKLNKLSLALEHEPPETVKCRIEAQLLSPLNL
ncbi:MAG: hypothetical protein KKB30_12470 [Proteobacteria bacterium]|nr:hypothetical protein [Pseudomonadota bacterium]MBU1715288.1 hypothetical protein [Pseudomonadota bacterium]